jgi:hypothetical protein
LSDNKLLTREALVGVIDAVAETVASNPDRIAHILSDDWLSTLVKSVADTMADAGIRQSITREGLEQMLKGVLQTFGEQPQLIIDDIDKKLASKKLKTQDIIIFLGTIRAQMALKLSNGASVDTFEQRKSAAQALAGNLKS